MESKLPRIFTPDGELAYPLNSNGELGELACPLNSNGVSGGKMKKGGRPER